MRVAINPHFFRQWYDRLAKPIFLEGTFDFYDEYDVEVTNWYIVPANKFALILSLTVNAARGSLTGYIGYVAITLQMALREDPELLVPVWNHTLRVGPKGRDYYSDIGHMGFLRSGDKVRWVVSADPQGGHTVVVVHLWLVEYLFEG